MVFEFPDDSYLCDAAPAFTPAVLDPVLQCRPIIVSAERVLKIRVSAQVVVRIEIRRPSSALVETVVQPVIESGGEVSRSESGLKVLICSEVVGHIECA